MCCTKHKVIWHGHIQLASVLCSLSAANWVMCQWCLGALRFHSALKVADCDKPLPVYFLWNLQYFTPWWRWQCLPLGFGSQARLALLAPLAPRPWPCLWVWMDTFQLDWAPSQEITAGFTSHPNKALCSSTHTHASRAVPPLFPEHSPHCSLWMYTPQPPTHTEKGRKKR